MIVTTDIPVWGYTAGQTYSITLQISQASISRFGFEITCEEGNFGSGKTGSFGIIDATTTKFINNNTAVTHTQAGTFGSGSKTWSMNWTAPFSSPSGIVFYVSAMAANGNGNNSGDDVYTTSYSFMEASSSVSEKQNNITAFINPISRNIMINSLEPAIISNLEIHDVSGKLITSKKNLLLPNFINVDCINSGIYIVTMNLKNGGLVSKKIIIP